MCKMCFVWRVLAFARVRTKNVSFPHCTACSSNTSLGTGSSQPGQVQQIIICFDDVQDVFCVACYGIRPCSNQECQLSALHSLFVKLLSGYCMESSQTCPECSNLLSRCARCVLCGVLWRSPVFEPRMSAFRTAQPVRQTPLWILDLINQDKSSRQSFALMMCKMCLDYLEALLTVIEARRIRGDLRTLFHSTCSLNPAHSHLSS
jgi:hypothetical protein